MDRATKIYMGAINTLGLLVGLRAAWRFFFCNDLFWQDGGLGIFLVLLLLCWGCCCLPLYLRDDCTVDLSFISILASVLLLGTEGAVTVCLITYPFVIAPLPDGKHYGHIFNTQLSKTLFNLGCRNLSVAAGGMCYTLAGGVGGDITLPGVLIPALLFILVAMLVNVLVVMFYFFFAQRIKLLPTFFQMFFGLAPSIACTAPIGYFLAALFSRGGGLWLAILFMFPLLLARFSFKLYLDGKQHQYHIVQALTAALEAKDTYTEGHSQRVGDYAVAIAREMGLRERQVQLLRSGAVFHDIGKIGVPDSILQKPGPLTPEERAVIQQHPEKGVRILKNLDGYEQIIPLVLHHHEFYDGRGYPGGTKGDDIPLVVYILGVADAYDAITSDRPYRAGRTPREAARILREEAGKQFHPDVAAVGARMADAGMLDRPESAAGVAEAESPC